MPGTVIAIERKTAKKSFHQRSLCLINAGVDRDRIATDSIKLPKSPTH